MQTAMGVDCQRFVLTQASRRDRNMLASGGPATSCRDAVQMRIRGKLGLLVVAAVAALLLTVVLIMGLVIQPTFAALEREMVGRNLARCSGAIDGDVDHLSVMCRDWAAWDDAYRFVEDGNKQFIDANVTAQMFANNRLNVLFFVRADRTVVTAEVRNRETGEPIRIPGPSTRRRAARRRRSCGRSSGPTRWWTPSAWRAG